MFGTLKENIVSNLENTYIEKGEKQFKKAFHLYTKTLKENKTLKEFYEVYDLVQNSHFDNEVMAKTFLEEVVSHLSKLDKAEVNKLVPLAEHSAMSFFKDNKWFSSSDKLDKANVDDHKGRFGDDIQFSVDGYFGKFNTWEEFEAAKSKPAPNKHAPSPYTVPNPQVHESITHKLDQLIFNENLSIKDRIGYKLSLIEDLTKKPAAVDPKQTFETLQAKISESVAALSEEETAILDLFVENDQQKISEYYTNLISETVDLADAKILACENVDVAKKLLEVKKKLQSMKTKSADIAEVEQLVNLKKSFL